MSWDLLRLNTNVLLMIEDMSRSTGVSGIKRICTSMFSVLNLRLVFVVAEHQYFCVTLVIVGDAGG